MSKTKSIAIVGGGAGGVSTLLQLINRLADENIKDISLTLIEKEKRVGPGGPYSTTSDESILNMRYQRMSIFPDKPNNVTDWLTENKDKWAERYPNFKQEEDPYPPRSLYGLYMEAELEKGLSKAKEHGIKVEVIKTSVSDIQELPEGILIKCQDGTGIQADKVVLALGNFPPTTYKELEGKPDYFSSFWPDEKILSTIPKSASIAILGSGLTAVDGVLTLLGHGYTQKLTLASRGGNLPKIQTVKPNPVFKDILFDKVQKASNNGVVSLVNLTQILKEQIEESCDFKINVDEIFNQKGSTLEILERDLEAAKTNSASCWQSVLTSTTDIIETLWNMLSEQDRLLFLKKYMGIWYVYRHAMPIKNAEKLLNYLKADKVEVCSGIQSVVYDEATKLFTLTVKNRVIKVQYVINATEAGLDITKIEQPLIQNLLKSGILKPSKFGGIDLDLKSCKVIAADNKVSDRIYTLGYLTRGVHFYTNDVGRISVYAKQIIEDILLGL